MPNNVLDDNFFEKQEKSKEVTVPKQKKEWWHKHLVEGEESVFVYREKGYYKFNFIVLILLLLVAIGAFYILNWINPEYGAGASLFFWIELLLAGPILDSKYVKPYIERLREKFGITRTIIVLTPNQVISKKKNIPLHKVTDVVYSQHSNYSRSNNFEEEIYCKLILRWSGVPVSYHINTEEEAKELAQKIKELIN